MFAIFQPSWHEAFLFLTFVCKGLQLPTFPLYYLASLSPQNGSGLHVSARLLHPPVPEAIYRIIAPIHFLCSRYVTAAAGPCTLPTVNTGSGWWALTKHMLFCCPHPQGSLVPSLVALPLCPAFWERAHPLLGLSCQLCQFLPLP